MRFAPCYLLAFVKKFDDGNWHKKASAAAMVTATTATAMATASAATKTPKDAFRLASHDSRVKR